MAVQLEGGGEEVVGRRMGKKKRGGHGDGECM